MKKFIFIPLLLISCGHDEKKNERNQPEDPFAETSLTGVSEKSFWDFSSESRCEGLKSVLTSYVSRLSNPGEIVNFACQDLTPYGRESYDAVVEVKSGNKSFISSMSLTKSSFTGTFCQGPFQSDRQLLKCSIDAHYDEGKIVQGVIEEQKNLLVILKSFVEWPQVTNLIYGMSPEKFYEKALERIASEKG